MWRHYQPNRFGRRNLLWPSWRLRNDRGGLHWDFALGGTSGPIQSNFPALNVWEADEGIIVTAEMPGILPEEINITVLDNELTISGERTAEELPVGARYSRRERASGTFSRTLKLGFHVDSNSVIASFQDGILQIELPRIPEEKPRKIEIKSA